MSEKISYFIVVLLYVVRTVDSDAFSVKIGTNSHINVVDKKFLSFTIDPEYLFSSNEKYQSKECVCMASALSPAYIRIAGPSTSYMTFQNTSITIAQEKIDRHEGDSFLDGNFKLTDILFPKRAAFQSNSNEVKRAHLRKRASATLSVTHKQWQKFVEWSNKTGFDIVFALNNQHKMNFGMWDPNSAMSLMSVADRSDVSNVVWQLGYECTNQSIEEYLYDLETLRVIVETFGKGKAGQWKVVGGDVTPCLQADSKSDFKDFVSLSNDRLDAILLDGNSSASELERMTEKDRLKLLRALSQSDTPLWLSEKNKPSELWSDLVRASDWMTSLGHAARNGFTVHFRELLEEEIFEPSMSFYMALLFKNLVGERVLDVTFETPSENSSLFAHCTSLRHKAVPGAVTLYGVNMDDEPSRFSLKLSKREEGGDIMQFIIGLDASGDIIVNGRPMYYEGDIRPVVKRVRPYKTLLLNLPPKTFGFWVLANTKIEACYDTKPSQEKEFIKAQSVETNKDFEESNAVRRKRSVEDSYNIDYPDFVDFEDDFNSLNEKTLVKTVKDDMKETVEEINNNINNINTNSIKKVKRQTEEPKQSGKILLVKKIKKPQILMKKAADLESKLQKTAKTGLVGKLLKLNAKLNETRHLRNERLQKYKTSKNKLIKRQTMKQKKEDLDLKFSNEDPEPTRHKRSIIGNQKDIEDINENAIDIDDVNLNKFNKMLNKINNKLNELPAKQNNKDRVTEEDNESEGLENQITLKTKITDDDAFIKLSEKSNNRLLKATFEKVATVLEEFSNSLDKFVSVLDLLQ